LAIKITSKVTNN